MRGGLTNENEVKIFILYLMNQVKHAVRYDDIANMTYESGYAGYFDFAEIFAKLAASGDVEQDSTGENFYSVTERGRAIAENLEHLIRPSSRTKGAAVAARYADLKKTGAAVSHSLEEDEESGGYRFRCAIKEKQKNSEIFHVSLLIKDKATAEKIAAMFKKNPNGVYRGVYAMLTGDVDFLF
jgi:hypothetical protein